jgi:outer membrane protein assembly factor BamB
MRRRLGSLPSSPREHSRRAVLSTLGGAMTIGLAGCLGDPGPPTYDLTQSSFDPEPTPGEQAIPTDDGITMFRRGLRRLGYYPEATIPDSVEFDWHHPVNYIGHNAPKASPLPTPDGETIIVPADTGKIHAFAPDGTEQWTTQTQATRQGFHATPVIVDGTAYLGGYDGANIGQEAAMYAVDTATGEIEWRTEEMDGSVAIGSSAGYWDGYLFVIVEHRHPEQKGELWVFDAETGEPLQSDDRIEGMPHPTVAIDPAHERLVTGSNDGRVYAWEFPSLNFAWSYKTDAQVKGPIATYNGTAIVGSWDHHIYGLDLDDGTKQWSVETDGVVMSAPGIDPTEGIAYVGSDDWHLYAIDIETGDVQWATNLYGRLMGGITVTPETVLAGTTAAELCAVEKTTGELRWFVETYGHVTSAPVPHNDRIYLTERAVVSGYWDDDKETTTETPGHIYCVRGSS